MAIQGVYFVTGKLGAGKSLVAVGRIRDKLNAGCPVATNLDIRVHNMINRKAKKVRLYRLPDKPTSEDMHALGSGNTTYDDRKNGLIVLDECGTWFNARSWQDKDRSKIVDWLIHARKLGWDIIFLVQDISMIDKQARKSVAEHVVYCRRLDKLPIPIIGTLFKIISGGSDIPRPKMHLGIVKYGDLPTSLTVDRWWYMGRDLYSSYDTKQIFRDDYPHGLFQVLPPYYSHGRYGVKQDWRFVMRMTRIYWKRLSRPLALIGGFLSGCVIASYIAASTIPQPQPAAESLPSDIETVQESEPESTEAEPVKTLAEKFAGMIVQGVARGSDGSVIYVQVGNDKDTWNLDTLRSAGYVVRMVNSCEVLIMNQQRTEHVRLFTSYCAPEKPPATPPRMTPAERYQWKLEQVQAMERLSRD